MSVIYTAIGAVPVLSLEQIVEKIGIHLVPNREGFFGDQVVYNRYVEIASVFYNNGQDFFPRMPSIASNREVAELFMIDDGMIGLMQIQGLMNLFASCDNVYTVQGNEITLDDLQHAALRIPRDTSRYPDCVWKSKNLAVFMNTEYMRYFAAADNTLDCQSIIKLSDPVVTNEKTMLVVRTKSRISECLIKDRKIMQISEILSSLATSGSPVTPTLATIMLFLIATDHGQTPTKWTQNSLDGGMLLLNPMM